MNSIVFLNLTGTCIIFFGFVNFLARFLKHKDVFLHSDFIIYLKREVCLLPHHINFTAGIGSDKVFNQSQVRLKYGTVYLKKLPVNIIENALVEGKKTSLIKEE